MQHKSKLKPRYLTLSGTKSTVDGYGNQRHNGHQANAPDRGIGLE